MAAIIKSAVGMPGFDGRKLGIGRRAEVRLLVKPAQGTKKCRSCEGFRPARGCVSGLSRVALQDEGTSYLTVPGRWG